jgi:cell division protein ZapA (FtsZ GTPase activity inhibitor)
MEEVSIKVTIGNRQYPLKVKKSEEERVLRAAKMLNDRISDYEQQYAVTDKLDLVAMCAMQFATELVNFTEESAKTELAASKELELLDQLVNSALKKNVVP